MAEQYLINDTTLTSIADAIRVVTGSYYGRATLLGDFSYWMDVMLPSEMPGAISGIVGIPDDVSAFIQRSAINTSCLTINGVSTLRSYAFAVSESSPYESVQTLVLNNVRTINEHAFERWETIESIFVLGSNVPNIEYGALDPNLAFSGSIYVWSSMYDQFLNDSVWNAAYSKQLYSVRNISDIGIRFTTSVSGPGNPNDMYSEVEHGQYLIQGTTLTSIASAIRGQLGVSTEYLPREMSTAVLSIGSPMDSTLLSIIAGTIKSFSDGQSSITKVGDYAFAYCTDLSSVTITSCTDIRSSAFWSCTALSSISCSRVSFIGSGAFHSCDLRTLSLSRVTEIATGALSYNYNLSAVSFPSCVSIGTYAFGHDSALTSVSIPLLESVTGSMFLSCIALSTVSFPNCSYIANGAFSHCSSLRSVYLMSTSMVVLSNSRAFESTPMSLSSYISGWGSIMVPASLYNTYYGNSVWSFYRARLSSVSV